MEKKEFRTLIKRDGKLGNNDYVMGVISGIINGLAYNSLCEDEKDEYKLYAIDLAKEGCIITVNCSSKVYYQIIRTVEYCYPGLCIFNY